MNALFGVGFGLIAAGCLLHAVAERRHYGRLFPHSGDDLDLLIVVASRDDPAVKRGPHPRAWTLVLVLAGLVLISLGVLTGHLPIWANVILAPLLFGGELLMVSMLVSRLRHPSSERRATR